MRWAVVAVWMGVIFLFSAQTGEESGGLSGQVVQWLASYLPLDADSLGYMVRKGAHVSEYAILGFLVAWALRASTWAGAALAGLVSVGYAATDEFHQTFVPGRAGQVGDVLIDSIGVAIGVLSMVFLASRGFLGDRVRHGGADHGRPGPVRQGQ